MKLELYSRKLVDTQDIATIFASCLQRGDVVGFSGDLGAGKTVFIKEVAQYNGINRDDVTSTSFVLAREYEGTIPILHTDVYRLEDVSELPFEIIEFIDSQKGIVLMEWVENVDLKVDFSIRLQQERMDERIIEIDSFDNRMEELQSKMENFILKL